MLALGPAARKVDILDWSKDQVLHKFIARPGDLFSMEGAFQKFLNLGIPQMTSIKESFFTLTFRHVKPHDQTKGTAQLGKRIRKASKKSSSTSIGNEGKKKSKNKIGPDILSSDKRQPRPASKRGSGVSS